MKYESKEDIITISDAVPEDFVEIQRLITDVSKGMYKMCGWIDEDIDKHFYGKNIENDSKKDERSKEKTDDKDILIVSKDTEGRIVGCCFVRIDSDKNIIEAVYIYPDYQGKGLAQKIFNEAYSRLDHSKDTYLDVFSLNERGVKFYKRIGFTETGKKFFDKKYSNTKGEILEITEMVLKGK